MIFLKKIIGEEGINLAEGLNYPFFECSAIENININEIFNELVKRIAEKYKREGKEIKLPERKSKNKNKICV